MIRPYNRYLANLPEQALFLTGTIKILLMRQDYLFEPTHNVIADISANEISGYTRPTLGTKTVTQNDSDNRAELRHAAATVLAIPETVGSVVWARDTGADATSPLMWWMDSGFPRAAGSDITIQPASGGVAWIREVTAAISVGSVTQRGENTISGEIQHYRAVFAAAESDTNYDVAWESIERTTAGMQFVGFPMVTAKGLTYFDFELEGPPGTGQEGIARWSLVR